MVPSADAAATPAPPPAPSPAPASSSASFCLAHPPCEPKQVHSHRTRATQRHTHPIAGSTNCSQVWGHSITSDDGERDALAHNTNSSVLRVQLLEGEAIGSKVSGKRSPTSSIVRNIPCQTLCRSRAHAVHAVSACPSSLHKQKTTTKPTPKHGDSGLCVRQPWLLHCWLTTANPRHLTYCPRTSQSASQSRYEPTGSERPVQTPCTRSSCQMGTCGTSVLQSPGGTSGTSECQEGQAGMQGETLGQPHLIVASHEHANTIWPAHIGLCAPLVAISHITHQTPHVDGRAVCELVVQALCSHVPRLQGGATE